MNTTVKGLQVRWSGNDRQIISADVDLKASQHAGVWLVNDEGRDQPFLMIIGVRAPEDAARAYARHRKETGCVLPVVFRVFPLTNLEPIALSGIVDSDGDEEWSAFSNAWVEVRL